MKLQLLEANRNDLINNSKKGDSYKDKNKGNRWTRKSKCSFANEVKDYNKINMDQLWKKDILEFGVKVEGETNSYIVTIIFNNVLKNIEEEVKKNKNLLTYDCILNALKKSLLNTNYLKVSCDCPDFKYRLSYQASQKGFKAGTKETREAKFTNPDDTKGNCCKHILAVLNNIDWMKKIASVINNYINYIKDKMKFNYEKYIFPKVYGVTVATATKQINDEKLESDEATINLSNALGKVRGRIQKGSNKNPVASKK